MRTQLMIRHSNFETHRLWILIAGIGCWSAGSFAYANDADFVIGSDPVFRLRVTVTVGESNWRDQFEKRQTCYHDLLFDRLDANADGRLTQPEAKRAPAPVIRLKTRNPRTEETHFAFNFLVLDEDRDGFISREELKTFYRDYETGPVGFERLSSHGLFPKRTTALFERLDQNGDAYLTMEEAKAAQKLWQFDRDGDEQLSIPGLASPAVVSPSGEFVAKVIPYDLPPVRNIAVKPLLTPNDAPAADVHLTYYLGRNSQFQFQKTTPAKSVKPDGERLVIRKNEVQVECLVQPSSLRLLEQMQKVLRREVSSLSGEKAISDEELLPAFLRKHAALMDANADGKLADEELESYVTKFLPARLAAECGRLVFRTTPPIVGLFATLDRNHNGMLSKPELSRLPNVFSELDKNEDGKLSQAEFPLIVRMEIARKTVPPPYLLNDQRIAGPPWFYRLDRNQDGVLSQTEFPGQGNLFAKLDRDGNKILTLKEAFAIENTYRGSKKAQEN